LLDSLLQEIKYLYYEHPLADLVDISNKDVDREAR